MRLADASNAICAATARDLAGSRSPLPVVYNGIASQDDANAGGAPLEPADLLYVGLASHRKRVALLPFVLRAVRRDRPEARLRIAGFDWSEAPELRAGFEALGLADAVECLGPLPADALPPVYRSGRVLVVPSAYEGLPYVVLEAFRAGTPVVATRVGGHAEVVEDGENGLLVPPDDPQALAAACLELLRDPARAQRMGDAGRERVRRDFDLERCVDAYLDYYRALSEELA